MNFCILRLRTIVKLPLDGLRAFPVGIFRDWCDVTVVLVELRWTPRRFHISSTAAIDYSFVPEGIAFGRIFAKLEDHGVVHVGDQVLRFFAELADLLRLSPLSPLPNETKTKTKTKPNQTQSNPIQPNPNLSFPLSPNPTHLERFSLSALFASSVRVRVLLVIGCVYLVGGPDLMECCTQLPECVLLRWHSCQQWSPEWWGTNVLR